MKTAKVTQIRDGNDYNSQNGLLHGWWVTMDNGDVCAVNTKPSQDGGRRAPWGVGETAMYTIQDTKQGAKGPWHKVKKEKPQDAQSGGFKSSWSPEKEVKIEVQGLVQAAIAGGASTQEQIEAMVALGMKAVGIIAPKVLAKRQAQAPVTNDPPATYQAPPPAQPQYQPQTNVAPSLRQPLPQNPAAGQVYQGAPSQGFDNDPDSAPF